MRESSLTRDEAFAALGLPAGATEDQVLEAFRVLSEDYGVRIANAPTNALKRTYQEKLEQLRAAIVVLVPNRGNVVAADLPAREPVKSEAPRFQVLPAEPSVETDEERPHGARRIWFRVFIAMGVLALGIMVLMIANSGHVEPNGDSSTMGASESLWVATLSGKNSTYLRQLPVTDIEFVFENATSRTVAVEWYSVAWINVNGQFQIFHAGDVGMAPNWQPVEVEGGKAVSFGALGKGRLLGFWASATFVGDDAAYYLAGSGLDAPNGRYRLTLE